MENVTMTIKQALKVKNQLIQEIQELGDLIRTNNSILVGNNRDYSISDLMIELDSKILNLVRLKAKIQVANQPILDKIYLLSELKTKATTYKCIDTKEGKQRAGYGNNSEPDIFTVEMSQVAVRKLIKGIEAEIIIIQDELDTFNSITHI